MPTERDMFRLTTDTDETTFYIPPGTASVMMIEDPHGNQLGISFRGDGTFVIAGWDKEGEWIELTPMAQDSFGNSYVFPLDQYTNGLTRDADGKLRVRNSPDKQ